MRTPRDTSSRRPLTRDRIVRAAVDLADRDGVGALTMRALGAELGVEAMSLYKHVASKDEILDGIVEHIVGLIEVPTAAQPWKQAMRQRAMSARDVLRQHSWAIGLLEARGSMGPAALRYTEAILGNLRSAGFALDDAAHAFWLLDSYVYGHVIQETSIAPSNASDDEAPLEESVAEQVTPSDYPNLAELGRRARESGYSVDREFTYGLDLILDALERAVSPAPA